MKIVQGLSSICFYILSMTNIPSFLSGGFVMLSITSAINHIHKPPIWFVTVADYALISYACTGVSTHSFICSCSTAVATVFEMQYYGTYYVKYIIFVCTAFHMIWIDIWVLPPLLGALVFLFKENHKNECDWGCLERWMWHGCICLYIYVGTQE
jgi:hypothetical protein